MGGVEDLKSFIEEDISKERVLALTVGNSMPEELATSLWEMTMRNEHPLSWRAMWFLEHLGADNHEILRPYLKLIVAEFLNFKFDGQRRSALKILQMFPVTDYDYGVVLNFCFDIILSNNEPIAVRSFAMQIVFDIAMVEPELKPELKEVIKLILPENSKGIQSKARKLLAKL